MELSIYIARTIGILYLSVGLGMLLFNEQYVAVFKKIMDSPGYALLGGFMAVVGGIAMVTYHNLWVNDWRVVITVIGWIALIKGVLLLFMPSYLNVFKKFMDFTKGTGLSIAILLLGLIFTYLGFFN